MAAQKTSGIGDQFFVDGYDLSGDTQQLGRVGGGPAVIDQTDITQGAHARAGTLLGGEINWTAYFDKQPAQAHAVLSGIPVADRIVTYAHQPTVGIGASAASHVCKQIGYDPNRGNDASLTIGVASQSTGYPLEWGQALTLGTRTDTTATNGTSLASSTGSFFISLPGSSGNTITTPDANSLDIVGDIDIRLKIAAADWTPTADSNLLSKYLTTGNQRSYTLILSTTGTLVLQWSADGTTSLSSTSTANLAALANDSIKWVRATLDVDNGAIGNTTTFYTSDDGVTWTQLGAPVVKAGITSIFVSTSLLEIGASNTGTANFFAGKFFQGEVRNGLAGTVVAAPVATLTGVTDGTPLTWTVNGTAFASVLTPFGWQAYLHVFAVTGTSVTVKLQDSADNATWADLTGGAFIAATTLGAQRLIGAPGTIVRRYVRAVTTGTFTNAQFFCSFVRNTVAVTF